MQALADGVGGGALRKRRQLNKLFLRDSVVVNFMTQRMTVEFAEGSEEKAVMKDVIRACKRVEEDCEIYL